MYGIRVSGLPANTTDKHLKVYFSNPRNGGGHILNIYHPLPHGTAVVIFDDKRVVQEVLKREHYLLGQPIGISATPRQVYRRAVVELEKDVSNILCLNPQLVDELQFIGEININFQYEKERYLFDGTWYKIEWAMQYLDTVLDEYQSGSKSHTEYGSPVLSSNRMPQERAPRQQFETWDDSPPPSHQIKHPNIPVVKHTKDDEQPKSLPLSNFSKMSRDQSGNYEDLVSRGRKNKNALVTSETAKSKSTGSKLYSNTLRSNLDDKNSDVNYYQSRGAVGNSNGNEYWSTGAQSFNRFGKGDDSDSENEANLAAAYDRRVGFSSDTNFDEIKRRPQRPAPRMTKGIDVSHTDFGEVPLSFTFELPGTLKVHVAMDDVTKQTTDTIVNPTTCDLSNVYGISRALVASAGYEMNMECQRYVKENGPLNYAGVMHTAAGGNLSDKVGFVIHTAGPSWREEESDFCTHMLVCTYINCFQYADEKLWVQSLATPLISAGSFGFPLDVCIGAFYDALLIFSDQSTTKRHLKEIHLVCFDQDSAMATITIVQSLLDCDSSQSVAAATDRYWMRKAKHNFQAENFSKPEADKDQLSDEDSRESKPKERTKEESKEPKKEFEKKSDILSDSDDERMPLDSPYVKPSIASGTPGQVANGWKFPEKMDLELGKIEPSTQSKGSFTDELKQKEGNNFDEDSDNDSFDNGFKEHDKDKTPVETEDKSLLQVIDKENKDKYVESDNESNSETENIEKERFFEEKVHEGEESKKVQKFDDIGSERDEEIDTDGNVDKNDEDVTDDKKECGARQTQDTRRESADDLKMSQGDKEGGASSNVDKVDDDDDDEEITKEKEQELYL